MEVGEGHHIHVFIKAHPKYSKGKLSSISGNMRKNYHYYYTNLFAALEVFL